MQNKFTKYLNISEIMNIKNDNERNFYFRNISNKFYIWISKLGSIIQWATWTSHQQILFIFSSSWIKWNIYKIKVKNCRYLKCNFEMFTKYFQQSKDCVMELIDGKYKENCTNSEKKISSVWKLKSFLVNEKGFQGNDFSEKQIVLTSRGWRHCQG